MIQLTNIRRFKNARKEFSKKLFAIILKKYLIKFLNEYLTFFWEYFLILISFKLDTKHQKPHANRKW